MNNVNSVRRKKPHISLIVPGRRTFLLNFVCLLLPLLLAAGIMSACQNNNKASFPLIPSDSEQASEPDQDETSQNRNENPPSDWPEVAVEAELVIAVPFGHDALEMLRLYFLAEQSGLLIKNGDPHFGQQVLLADLQAFDGPLQLTLETVSLDRGARAEDLAVWAAAASLPDILYGLHDQKILKEDHFLDLTPYLANNPDLNPSHLYGSLLDAGRAGQAIFGIPYLASIPLLYADYTFMLANQIDIPESNWTWQQFLNLSRVLQDKLVDLEQDLSPDRIASLPQDTLFEILPDCRVVLADPLPLMAWLPAQADKNLGWMTWSDGHFQMEHPAAEASWAFISGYVEAGFTPYHLNESNMSQAGFDRPLALNGRALLWFDSSARLASWHQQDKFDIITLPVPDGPPDAQDFRGVNGPEDSLEQLADRFSGRKLPTDVRLLAVSSNSQYPDTAVALAVMIALDEESLLIQSRFQLYEGFFPVVQSEAVWTAMVRRQVYGHVLYELRERLSSVLINGGMLTDRQTLEDRAAATWFDLLEQQRIDNQPEPDTDDIDMSGDDSEAEPADPANSQIDSGQAEVTIDDPPGETTADEHRTAAEQLLQLSLDLNQLRGD